MPKKATKKRKGNPGKGSSFERDFARKLSLWWSDGQADDWFWRVGGSGGRATQRAKSGKGTANGCGDIAAQGGDGQRLLNLVTFELKRGYNSATIQDLLDKPEGPNQMRDFIEQAKRSASIAGTPYWILVVKRDRREELVITDYNRWIGDFQRIMFRIDDDDTDSFSLYRLSDFFTKGVHQHFEKVIENASQS
mgnify:CR=1 FL=1